VLNGGLNLFQPRARDLRDAVYVLLKNAGAPYSRKDATELCGRWLAIQQFRGVVIEAWRASTPDPALLSAGRGDRPAERQTWMEAWSIGHRRLRLTPAEWLAMTPRMVGALLADYLEEARQHELMQSKIVAAVVNFGGMGGRKELVADEAFMIHPWPKPERPAEEGPVTGEELMGVFAAFRGAPERKHG
jgi:hypothetical protein